MIYYFKRTAIFLWFIVLMLTIYIVAGIAIVLTVHWSLGELVGLAIVIPVAWCAPEFAAYITSANMIVHFDEAAVTIEFVPGRFVKKSGITVIKWSDIKNYRFRTTRRFDKLKIILTDKSTIRFAHDKNFDKDDFGKFMTNFEDKIKSVNKTIDTTSHRYKL